MYDDLNNITIELDGIYYNIPPEGYTWYDDD